jgi:E3 ubiquitin-protein ligase synoviolin
MKFASYVTLSATAMIVMIYYAYYTRKQFYPTILFLVSSKLSFIVACNLGLALSLMVARFIKTIYFGNLREVEAEVLIERAKYAIVETCLALTIFRNELTTSTVALFGSLILFKLLHKLSKCRMEHLEQITPLSTYAQLRMGCLLLSLLVIDGAGIAFAVHTIMRKGTSVLILFGFEFGLLMVYTINLSIRFFIQIIDNMITNGLQSRGLCIMVTDLACDVIKVITYGAFFSLIFVHYGVPFHLIRDLWATIFSFQRKLLSFIKYLQLTRNLDEKFPDATSEELAHAGSCLVCREDMERGKRLPCGHVFHLDCLRMWLQHQQTCPLCRLVNRLCSSVISKRSCSIA